ncbi:branched-chain amino acid ABC transporter permease [Rhodomicrobium lacus]|uniref:branched-chain amino acid ABC transporter permease n=1 Tax=Rhodomicrobium lacus TaxID=2498452 RepID=UPI0026E28AA0|nr:branched-chain amino acid ABC transporter permease [Rhodomicrobium lacus]WKW51053.1 branched-chain amino acid ABC transporter permease [Rhodomicrobium lacus]
MTSVHSVLPFIVNGISLGLSISLVALAMALIWRTAGIVDFGLGAIYLFAAYATFVLTKIVGLPLPAAILGALAVGCATSVLLYVLIYRGFIKNHAPLFVMVLVGISVFTAAQNLISAFGSPEKRYVIDQILPGIELLGTRLNAAQIAKMAASLIALVGVALFCTRTGPGLTICAVADNKTLAQGVGIAPNRTYIWVYAIAGLLVAFAAIPDTLETGVDPFVAMNPVFLALAAIIIGGLNTFKSPILGAVLLGLAFHLAVWILPATWQEVVAYGFVLAVLLARPQGLFGGINPVRERA